MKDLRWILPWPDEEVQVNRHGPREFVVDRYHRSGGEQHGPFRTRREARAAALALVVRDNGWRRH